MGCKPHYSGIDMFGFIKDKIKKIYATVTKQVSALFARNSFDEQFLKELSALLIAADTGVKTTSAIIQRLTDGQEKQTITTMEQAKHELEAVLGGMLAATDQCNPMPTVVVLVGINGSGKTSFVAKYAHYLQSQGKKTLIVAADTFRAAAVAQLGTWANRLGVEMFQGKEGQDPASVVFDACAYFKANSFDHLIIDTAGRLQTKVNLMKELEKIYRTVTKQLPGVEVCTWLTIDAMLGQNSLAQAEVFYQATKINGLILTKLDGTGKGGIVFAIVSALNVPIVYVTLGEGLDDMKSFDGAEYVKTLLYE